MIVICGAAEPKGLTMRFLLATPILLLFLGNAQDETSRSVAGGGISVPGWKGTVDPNEAKTGKTINDAKFAKEGAGLHAITGPAVTYWNPTPAKGNYTVKATFSEPKYMNLNTHPHPYGIVIGGTGVGTDQENYLYCAANGAGNFIVRGFGPEPFQLNGRRGEANEAVHKAAGPGQPVTQEIAISVTASRIECSINGTMVAGYDRATVVAPGKLASTDGAYGLRFAHNTEVIVTGLSVTKN
jgi:hypothetical protein